MTRFQLWTTRWSAPAASLAAVSLAVLLLVGTPIATGDDSPAELLALKGLDPVHLVRGEEIKGKDSLEVSHHGYRYRFASTETRDAFQEHPERFRIQNETCPVYPGATIDPSLFVVHEGRIWAFASEGCIEEFKANPDTYIEGLAKNKDKDGETSEKGDQARNVAVLVYDGVELLDFAGPGEVFAAAGHGGAFEVFTVGPSHEPVVSQGFVQVTPTYAFADAPAPDIVVIPGGGVGSVIRSSQAMAWLQRVADQAEIVLSVCNGALVLARAGLLDGLEATTHHGSLVSLRKMAPHTRVHDDRRFVDNGHIVTAAGVSAGIDASLHVVRRLQGAEQAQRTARYMEYPWRPNGEATTSERLADLSGEP